MAKARGETQARVPAPPPSGTFTVLEVAAARWYRVHRFNQTTGQFGPTEFNDTAKGSARFSPLMDPSTGTVIPTLYAAQGPAAAICEVVLRNVPVPSHGYLHDVRADTESDLHVSEIDLPTLRLADLTTTGMNAAGLPPYVLLDQESARYTQTREWALWTWENVPEAQGLFWMSGRYSRESAIMLFGDRVQHRAIRAHQSRPLSEFTSIIINILTEMGAGVTPHL